jgi:hypothetical protein
MNGNANDNFLGGFAEGFAAPLIEGVLAYTILQLGNALQPIVTQTQSLPGGITFTFSDLLILFTLMILAENIGIGLLGKISMAIGYCIGAFFAILAYASIVRDIFPNMAQEIWGMIVIIGVGIILRLIISYKIKSKNRYEGDF